MRALLYRPSWQSLRVSFLKENRNDGGWTTVKGTRDNLSALLKYNTCPDSASFNSRAFEAATMGYREEHEIAVRLYRSINCLNAVRMGNSGQGTKGSQQDRLVLDFRDMLQRRQTAMYHQWLTYAAARWDWRVVKRELQAEYDKGDMHDRFDEIELNLRARAAKASTISNRPELVTFMQLMKEVRNGD